VDLDLQPTLTGERVWLRPLQVGDFSALYAIAADPTVWEQHPSKERAEEAGFRAWWEEAIASGGTLVAEDRGTHDVIGTSRFVVRSDTEIEIGWTFLAPDRWGGGWNGEMKRLMLDHAFTAATVVRFTVHSENFRSQRAVERLGAARVGTETDCLGRGTNIVFHLSAHS
jgi:RimJ/RimL family protein N-acetyltransferase